MLPAKSLPLHIIRASRSEQHGSHQGMMIGKCKGGDASRVAANKWTQSRTRGANFNTSSRPAQPLNPQDPRPQCQGMIH